MRRELGWAGIAVAMLAVATGGAEGYARLAAPYYAAVARLMALGHPWQIVSVEVGPSAVGPGSVLVLVGDVRRHAGDARPSARVVARVHVGEAVETPAVFWTLLLLWPAVAFRRRLVRIAVGFPVFLGLEAITTGVALVHGVAEAADFLASGRDRLTLGEGWTRFLEAGGHFGIEVCAALLVIVLTQTGDKATLSSYASPGARAR